MFGLFLPLFEYVSHLLSFPPTPSLPLVLAPRGNQLGIAGWAAVGYALERVSSITSLNGCDKYAAIRTGGLQALNLSGTELGLWASTFLERSASTLTRLDVRCAMLA